LSRSSPGRHAFVSNPHRTLAVLTFPVLLSLLLEPLTGIVDTFFVARLGALELAALGISTAVLSSVIWVFNFVGIGAQTEVARCDGAGDAAGASEAALLAMTVGAGLGLALAIGFWPAAPAALHWMGAEGGLLAEAVVYLQIRLLGAAPLLVTLAGFGALRGVQDMRTPFWIALGSSALNAVLDPLLIFGAGPVPALGVAGAAIASTAAHWLAAGAVVWAVRSRFGVAHRIPWRRAPQLLVVGRDLVARTALLLLFQLLATRKAAAIGVSAIAAHHAVRQLWTLSAFVLDAYAAAGQTLVGYFLGADEPAQARRVAGVACGWGAVTGVVIGGLMWAGEDAVALAFVPAEARAEFHLAWLALLLAQPLNALSFVTDGLHWGSADYAYLRNAMIVATATGLAGLYLVDPAVPGALFGVWLVTGAWITVRAGFGMARIWPGIGASPFRRAGPAGREGPAAAS